MSRKKTLILLPLFIAIAAYLYWQQHQRIYADQGRLTIAQERDAVVLYWQGDISVPMAKRFSETFEEWRDKTNRFVIDLNSPGGFLREGGNVIEIIDSLKRTHDVDTRVTAHKYCLSMCVPIFLQGENRIADKSSNWMFHQIVAEDFFTGEEVIVSNSEREYSSNKFFEKYFTNSEMDPSWREGLREEWIGKDVWRTGQQLVNERSNIILELQ